MTNEKPIEKGEYDGPTDSGPPIEDPELRLRLAGGDRTLAEELLQMLVSELPNQRRNINQAFLEHDEERLATEVHTLCGSAAYCGVPALESASDALRRVARSGDPTTIGQRISKLNREIDRLLAAQIVR